MDKVISSKELEIDLQPPGRKSKNVLSFLHMILTEMVVINPEQRSPASKIIANHYPSDLTLDLSSIIRFCLFGYLRARSIFSEYYLIPLCAYIDYYRLDSKIKEDSQSAKRKICFMVKKTIFQIIGFIRKQIFIEDSKLFSLY